VTVTDAGGKSLEDRATPAKPVSPASVVPPETVKAAVLPAPPAPSVETQTAAVEPKALSEVDALLSPPLVLSRHFKGLLDMVTTSTSSTIGAEKVQALFGDFSEQAKNGLEKSTKLGKELMDITKGNVEALVTSSRVAAQGAQALTQGAAEYGKKSFETATDAFKGFAAAKTPAELFQLQGAYAKSSFESAAAEASKLSEAWVKLASEIFDSLSSQYVATAGKIKAATTK